MTQEYRPETCRNAKKWYLLGEQHDGAIALLQRTEARDIELLAPGVVQPGSSVRSSSGSIAEKAHRSTASPAELFRDTKPVLKWSK